MYRICTAHQTQCTKTKKMKKLTTLILMGMLCGAVSGQVIDDVNKNIIGYNRLQTGNGDWMDIQLMGTGSKFQMLDHTRGKYFIRANSGNKYVEFPQNIFVRGKIGIGISSPTTHLHLNVPSLSGLESAFKVQVNDAISDYFQIQNGTGVDNQFIPILRGYRESDNRTVLGLTAAVPDANDTGSSPLMTFDARRQTGKINNRPLFQWNSYGTNYMTMSSKGYLGIGSITPIAKLTIQSTERGVNSGILVQDGSLNPRGALYFSESGQDFVIDALSAPGGSDVSTFKIRTGSNDRLNITRDGLIGIGTITPSAKLDVAGNIKAHEIEVTLASINDMQLNGTLAANNITYTANGNTADFVFEDNYQLKDLSEVEAFIKANKHLPEIPSADEMEEAGVNLAEMNKLLLMKVEELTLYSIEQEKKIEELSEDRKRVTEVESELNNALKEEATRRQILEERLNQMEKILTNLNKQ